MLLTPIALLIVGLALLVWSADKLVYGAAGLARNFGISPLVIGMTIIAMGSSAPEMVVSATAALAGKTDTAVGNVIGSNIANIALILGITALLKPLSVSSNVLRREIPMMFGVTALAGVLLMNNYLSFTEGLILMFAFVSFIVMMLMISKKEQKSLKDDPLTAQHESELPEGLSNGKAIFWAALGLILLPIASTLLVNNAVIIAKYFGMSDLVIGLTIIAVGTSLPELAASLASALKGEDDLAVGNVIGSNIFNILAVMGIPAVINPSAISLDVMIRDYWVMCFFSAMLLIMSLGRNHRINRFEGLLLFLGFVAYIVYLLFHMAS